MKFIPILFSTPMVQAILEGHKTMTRRVIKLQPGEYYEQLSESEFAYISIVGMSGPYKCPYGQPGDVFWVREAHYAFGQWKRDGITKTRKQKWRFEKVYGFENIRYMDNKPFAVESPKFRGLGWYKRSSLFMPKEACRLFLKVTDVRVERLQDIRETDACSEGIGTTNGFPVGMTSHYLDYMNIKNCYSEPINSFKSLWQSINGLESWEDNPWVWVISFDRIRKPENFI